MSDKTSTRARRSAVVGVFAALLVSLLPQVSAVSAGPTGATAASTAGQVAVTRAAAAKKPKPAQRYGKQAQKATNAARKRNDLKKLRPDPCLRKWARKHANRLAKSNSGLWHQDLGPVLRNCNLKRVGENVAAGYPTGKKVVNQGWLKSPGHRTNILTPQFRRSVVVARRSNDGRWYAVQLFGRR